MKSKFGGTDRCSYCGHWSGDDERPFVIYTEERAKWLEEGVQMAIDNSGDDSWVDWMDKGKQLKKAEKNSKKYIVF